MTTTKAKAKPAFVLDPTLPWLFSDRTMQDPAALRNMKTVTLSNYEPMGQYFPQGTEVAMKLVTSLDQLIEGAAYWHELTYYEPNVDKFLTRYSFGRYAGLAYPNSKSTTRRWKQGDAHITLESDVLDCDLYAYCLHEDGTKAVFVNTSKSQGPGHHALYQVTHYVTLPTFALAVLGPEAVQQTGMTLRQAAWLKQEEALRSNSYELTMHMEGGLALPDYRVVLPRVEFRDFMTVQESCPMITASQARKCKSGTISITLRHSNHRGRDYVIAEHYKLVDGAILIDWMRHHSNIQDSELNAAISKQSIEFRAEAIKAQRKAEEAAKVAANAADKVAVLECPFMPEKNEYADILRLAHAA